MGKFILWLSAAAFISYGLACFFMPGLAAGYAGLEMTSGDAFSEIGAMYGGLQTGFGIFCAMGATREGFYRPALTALMVVIGLLAVGRLYSTITGPGDVGFYTWGAMTYEFFTAIVAGLALRKS